MKRQYQYGIQCQYRNGIKFGIKYRMYLHSPARCERISEAKWLLLFCLCLRFNTLGLLELGGDMESDNAVLTIEVKNSKPIDLIDLTTSLAAFAEAFKDFATEETGDPLPGNMRLYVKEIRSGSIIADLIALNEQAAWLLEHAEVFGAFVTNINDVANFFLGRPNGLSAPPTVKQARQISQILDPVAKDYGSQMNINVSDGGVVNIHQHIHFIPVEANAIQNKVDQYLGPKLPAEQIMADKLMVLEQVKNNPSSKSGDRGVIEAISPKAVKLQFVSEEVKRKVLELKENPLQSVFLVDVDVRSIDGKPMLYRILDVKDIIERD